MELKDLAKPFMGEVRVKIRLTNGADRTLAHLGQLEERLVRSVETDAMVDTGAVRCAIPASLAKQLGVLLERGRTVAYADGRSAVVPFAGPIHFEIEGRDTYDDALVLGDEVLIGQTVLEKMDFLVDCARQRLVPAHPDGPVDKLK
jgi:predicted aspartyl protease